MYFHLWPISKSEAMGLRSLEEAFDKNVPHPMHDDIQIIFFVYSDSETLPLSDSSSKMEEKFTHFHLLETTFPFLLKAISTFTVNQP